MHIHRNRPPLTIKDVFAAIGAVSTAVALLYPAVQCFAWGVAHPLLATVIALLVLMGLIALFAGIRAGQTQHYRVEQGRRDE